MADAPPFNVVFVSPAALVDRAVEYLKARGVEVTATWNLGANRKSGHAIGVAAEDPHATAVKYSRDPVTQTAFGRVLVVPRCSPTVEAAVHAALDGLPPESEVHVRTLPRPLAPGVTSIVSDAGFLLLPRGPNLLDVVVMEDGRVLSGLSTGDSVGALLSCGDARRSAESKRTCRAYWKLHELFLRAPAWLKLKPTDVVLDVGAAPGGWTEYCSDTVSQVIAVDPGHLTFTADNVTHMSMRLQDAVPQLVERGIIFDAFIADMNVPVDIAFRLLRDAQVVLKPETLVIVTCKNFSGGRATYAEALDASLKELSLLCTDVFTVQLFANGVQEVTVAARLGDADTSKWDAYYAGGALPPWDTRGEPSSHLVAAMAGGVFPPGASVVELGCGRGNNLIHLAAAGVAATGVEFSGPAVEAGKAAAASAGVEATFIQADLLRLGVSHPDMAHSFDGLFDYQTFHTFYPDGLALAARSMRWLLKPGARAVIVTGNDSEPMTLERGPVALSVQTVVQHFTVSGGWRVDSITASRFDATPAYGETPPAAWVLHLTAL